MSVCVFLPDEWLLQLEEGRKRQSVALKCSLSSVILLFILPVFISRADWTILVT